MDKVQRIKKLITELNNASNDYYNSTPTMTDYEWDKKYDELKILEEDTHIIYPNSPTQNVGYKVLDGIKEVEHNHPMLSLDKCHSEEELIKFASDKDCVLSVKADGLSCSLRYLNGELVSGETRGNGTKGQDVLENVLNIKNIPHTIPYKDELIIDGEVIIDWNTFAKINDNLPAGQEKYKHPRNLVSGTLTMYDTKVAADREMRFIAWRVIKGLDNKVNSSVFFSLKEIEKLGFEIVPMWTYTNKSSDKDNLSAMLSNLQDKADELVIPYDGAVMAYDNVEYGMSLGLTGHHPRHSIAYKYEQELHETVLEDIEWQTSKTGLINPVAKFEECVIDGASVTKATLYNISCIENLQLGLGDKIRVYKANQIIPKVHDNLTRSNTWKLPTSCPVCGGAVEVHNENGSKTLHCTNPNCSAKLLGKLSHFVSRDAMNVDGLSEATLQKFIDLGFVTCFEDIYYLDKYKTDIANLDGFGIKSVTKMLGNIESSKDTTLERFIYSLSIPLIGKSASKIIAKFIYKETEKTDYEGNIFDLFMDKVLNEPYTYWLQLDDFGEKMALSLYDYFAANGEEVIKLAALMNFEWESAKSNSGSASLEGLTFVVTGSVEKFKNRKELSAKIEELGGKVAGSVSAKTNYLINNDINSTSSKNAKAKSLGIPIISEDEFLSMIK